MRRSERLFDAITDIKDDILRRAEARYEAKSVPVWKKRWPRAVAAVLAAAILGGVLLKPDGRPGSPLALRAYAVAAAEYPKMARYPGGDGGGGAYEAWREDIQAQRGPEGYADGLEGFFAATMQEFLSDDQGENVVYSPLNVYMALAALAELTGGDSRRQILDFLGHDSVDTLREQAGYLWNANYRSDGATTSVLASSVWLREGMTFQKSALETLAERYYASSYQGRMGSDSFDEALQTWLNDQTGGLLAEQVKGQRLDEDTVLALATTVYFKAKWHNQFSESRTTREIFHAAGGGVEADFMHQTDEKTYYWGERFSAVAQHLENAGSMWFLLPDEGVTVDELLEDEEAMAFLLDREEWENSKRVIVHETIPKFDVVSQFDLSEGLASLGVTDVFSPTRADFSPVTDFVPVWVGQTDHAARVIIDEEGCTAAAYTVMAATGAAPPPDEEVEFVVDRPFLFLLTGIDGLPLFVGVVNRP